MDAKHSSFVTPLFRWIVNHPKRVLLLGIIVIMAFASQAPNITQDTRSDAFLTDDNPALVYRDKVKEIFGLSDPMVIAVTADASIFSVEGLNTVHAVTEAAMNVVNIDPDGVKSLATENNIIGTDDGMEVEPFYEAPLSTSEQALFVRNAIRDFPLYQGSMVARDETATLVIAELLDENQAEQTYLDLVQALNTLELPTGITLHIAGEGAISGYLGSYISSDAQTLNPLAALIITIIVFLAFLRFGTTLAANLVIAASAVLTVGTMAMSGVPFYVITNALPVILIGISVADTIHIYSEYYERRAFHPEESVDDAIVASMESMWRPITLTTLTTAAGFMGLFFAAYMPPFKSFGLFTAFGVTVAWLYSMLFLPAFMTVFKSKVRPSLAKKMVSKKHDIFAKIMVLLGRFTHRYARLVVGIAATVVIVGILAATQLVVNEERIRTFHPSEPLYKADMVINGRFDGSNYLDVVIETPDNEGIFDPEVLQKIERLQTYAETLPNVQGSTSVVDYLKQMNRALNEGQKSEYRLPEDKDLVAQYFLLYSASSEPTDFEEEIDYDYRLANVRINLNTGSYTNNKFVVKAMEEYLATEFNTEHLTGTLSGRVNLTYNWIKDLGVSHFTGVGIALLLVWLVSSLLFGSAVAGAFALLPVVTSILLVYSAMVWFGIPLGIGTSMFAAVAIGLGVDFAIHTIDRLRHLYQRFGNMDQTLEQFYPSTGRALFFNLLAIALGFGVLISSKVVPLNNFGTIVAISVTTSFIISMTLLPALALLFKPAFITQSRLTEFKTKDLGISNAGIGMQSSTIKTIFAVGIIGLVSWAFLSNQAIAATSQPAENQQAELPDGRWVMQQVNNVEDGDAVTRKLTMKMIDKRGKERLRETIGYRKYFGDEKRTVLFYLTPKNVKGTGFLTYDYPSIEIDDDQWLYLPALRKSRRISASDRGDYFLGTDFSYDDIKKEGKIEINDYQFITLREETVDHGGVSRDTLVIQGVPVDDETAKELGYGRVVSWVDTSNWVVVKVKYWDIKMNPLKSLEISDIRKVDGIWTRHQMDVHNHKSGHYTQFVFSDVDYQAPVKDTVFTRQALSRGGR